MLRKLISKHIVFSCKNEWAYYPASESPCTSPKNILSGDVGSPIITDFPLIKQTSMVPIKGGIKEWRLAQVPKTL